MTQILLRDIEKRYGEVPVLHDCNLEIRENEFLVLVGPSGSGKTTLLRIIAGLEHITRGDLMFDGERMNDVDVGDRDIAMVFQNYGLYPHMSVYDNLAFGLRRRKMDKDEIDRRVRNASELLNIAPYLRRRPRQLSGGQRQRVALGRAIVRDPRVFLLDEPLSNLDAHLRVQMRTEILKVHRTVSATAIYVTHDQIEALTMGDRIVVMAEGRIHQVGTPDELYETPVNKFVASFIGTPSMGFVDCDVETVDSGVNLTTTAGHFRLSAGQQQAVKASARNGISVGIRPERLQLADEGEGDAAEVLVRGTVEAVEMLGAEQYVHFLADGGELTARVPRERPVKAGQSVAFTSEAKHLYLFDRQSALALR